MEIKLIKCCLRYHETPRFIEMFFKYMKVKTIKTNYFCFKGLLVC